MACYIVTYDLNKEVKRPPIVEEVKNFESWAKLSESSYAIKTSLTAEGVYSKLSKYTDENDQIYIITLKKPWMGFGPKVVNAWLDNNLSN